MRRTTEGKNTNRTEKKAGSTAPMPEGYAIITRKKYQDALSLNKPGEDGEACIVTIGDSENLEMRKNTVLVNGKPATEEDIYSNYSEEIIKSIALKFVWIIYNWILALFKSTGNIEEDQEIKIYIRNIYKYMDMRPASNRQKLSLIKALNGLKHLVGIIDHQVYPVVYLISEDDEENTITISAPYLSKLIAKMAAELSIKGKIGRPVFFNKGKASNIDEYHSYLINPALLKEDQKKVEIIQVIITSLVTAKTQDPYISLETILEKSSLLQNYMDGIKENKEKNSQLVNIMLRTFMLLDDTSLTSVKKKYPDFTIPDICERKNMPSIYDLRKEYHFRNK